MQVSEQHLDAIVTAARDAEISAGSNKVVLYADATTQKNCDFVNQVLELQILEPSPAISMYVTVVPLSSLLRDSLRSHFPHLSENCVDPCDTEAFLAVHLLGDSVTILTLPVPPPDEDETDDH